jgi:hypothetical protein
MAVIDTGSTVLLINNTVVKKLGANVSPYTKLGIKLINESTVSATECVALEIIYEEDIRDHTFVVMSGMKYQVLLGLSYCRQVRMLLKLHEVAELETVSTWESDTEDYEDKWDWCNVIEELGSEEDDEIRITKSSYIEPHEERKIKVYTNRKYGLCSIIPTVDLEASLGIVVLSPTFDRETEEDIIIRNITQLKVYL